ncbi:hypothetical protein MBLNU230_g2904t1 [Neophaeotheca triangularis]
MATLVHDAPSATQPAAQPVSNHPFTCNTCQVAFRSSDLQRTHMQSDWHRYNLKRRVASLPPLASDVFAEKVLANKATAAATEAKARFEKRCEACEKTFYSEGAYSNHLGSHKHRMLVSKMPAGTDTESMADSSFSLGEPMEVASTASTISTADPPAETEFEQVVEGMKQTSVNGNAEQAPGRPGRPTPMSAAQQKEHPLSASSTEPSPAAGEKEDMEEDENYEHKADLKQCLFCNYMSPTVDLNTNHMSRQHGFFIPEKEYLVDLSGLLTYLHETITVLHQCLFCHKQIHTASGTQTHMRDRGHCMIAYSTEEEQMDVGEFYDFRSTYSDDSGSDTEGEEDEGGVALGAKRAAKTTYQNEAGEDVDMPEGDDEGWESDSSDSSVPTDEITSVPVDHSARHHSHHDSRKHKNSDGFHSHAHHTPSAVYHDGNELHLPSGRTAGHRNLRTYYRQNLRNYPTPEERANQRFIEDSRHDSDADDDDDASDTNTERAVQVNNPRGRGRDQRIVTRANGGLGMLGVSEAKKKEARNMEKKELIKAQRAENRYKAGNERRNNHQKHYRDPLLQ